MSDFLKSLFVGLLTLAAISTPFVIGAMIDGRRGAGTVLALVLLALLASSVGYGVREMFSRIHPCGESVK